MCFNRTWKAAFHFTLDLPLIGLWPVALPGGGVAGEGNLPGVIRKPSPAARNAAFIYFILRYSNAERIAHLNVFKFYFFLTSCVPMMRSPAWRRPFRPGELDSAHFQQVNQPGRLRCPQSSLKASPGHFPRVLRANRCNNCNLVSLCSSHLHADIHIYTYYHILTWAAWRYLWDMCVSE